MSSFTLTVVSPAWIRPEGHRLIYMYNYKAPFSRSIGMAMATTTTAPPSGDLLCGPHANRDRDRFIAEWITGLNLVCRKQSRRREAMRSQGPASNEVLANVFQRLSPRSVTACHAACLKWSALLSSPRLASLADVGGSAGPSACLDGLLASTVPARAAARAGVGAGAATPCQRHQQPGFRRCPNVSTGDLTRSKATTGGCSEGSVPCSRAV